MKNKQLTDLRKKDIIELRKTLQHKRDDLDKIKLDLALGQENDFKKANRFKKDIAQIMTLIKEKEMVELELNKSKTKKGDDE